MGEQRTGQIRIADLPTMTDVSKENFLLVERPGYQEGTFKCTVSDLQQAVTVTASVTRSGQDTTIKIDDINGHTEDTIVTPTATVVDNHNNTSTIFITDTTGESHTTVVNKVVIDTAPTQGSPNLLTSGTLYDELKRRDDEIARLNSIVESLLEFSRYALVTEEGN